MTRWKLRSPGSYPWPSREATAQVLLGCTLVAQGPRLTPSLERARPSLGSLGSGLELLGSPLFIPLPLGKPPLPFLPAHTRCVKPGRAAQSEV